MSCASSRCCRAFMSIPGDRRAVAPPPPLAAPLDLSTVSAPEQLYAFGGSGICAFCGPGISFCGLSLVAPEEGRHVELEIEVEFPRQRRSVRRERYLAGLTDGHCSWG